MPELVLPHTGYHASFLAAMEEFLDERRTGGDSAVGADLARFGGSWHTERGFAEYVAHELALRERPARAGFVCQTTWWWIEDEEYVGRIAVRHELNERLSEVGGHIGYDVRGSRRREGHATAMLGAVLPEAHALGIDPALVTCSVDNIASRRVIEANGGVLEDRRGRKLRFWIPTTRVGR